MAMELPLQVVEDLAPDQSSLGAAKKLLSPSHWPLLGQSETHQSIWGQCKGSGANPYLTMADVVDHGYKCTCPSRKFPCKHVLALLWMYSQAPAQFTPAPPEEWVMEWLSRRRRPPADVAKSPARASPAKDISLATAEAPASELDADVLQRKQAQQQKRQQQTAEATQQALLNGLQELDLWISDQLRTGILALHKDLRERTRRIASRMVDAKASALASRIDELISMVRDAATEQQPVLILRELGCWLTLSRAFQQDPQDLDAKRALVGAESLSQIQTQMGSGSVMQLSGRWLCIGEQITQRRDGLIRHSSYLWPLDAANATHLRGAALLQDFYPATSGKRQGSMRPGTLMDASVAFYPSRWLQRALLQEYRLLPNDSSSLSSAVWSAQMGSHPWDISHEFIKARQQLPWLEDICGLVGPCQLNTDSDGRYWLATATGPLPLRQTQIPVTAAGDLLNACVRWNGTDGELLTALSASWGLIQCG